MSSRLQVNTINSSSGNLSFVDTNVLDLSGNSSNGLILPRGDFSSQGTPINRSLRFDTTDNKLKYSDNNNIWNEFIEDGSPFSSRKSSITRNGLVVWLDTISYPGSGTTWFDLSGNGYDGTFSNSNVFPRDGYVYFSGSSSYIEGVHNDDVNLRADITVESWFYITAPRGDWVRILGKGDSSNRTVGIWYNYNANYLLYQRYGPANMNIGGTSWRDGVVTGLWYYMVGTTKTVGDTFEHKLYINNELFAETVTGSTPYHSSTVPYRVGYGGIHTFHAGYVAQSRIYNRALTAEEINRNYLATRNNFTNNFV